jgi:hypothetical protein
MATLQNRRDFLKKAGVVTGLSQLPLSGWSEGFSSLFGAGINPAGEFSILKLEKLLPAYRFPFIDRFSTSLFKLHYSLYNLYGNNAANAGEFLFDAAVRGEKWQFKFISSRLANNGIKDSGQVFKYWVSGDVVCENNGTLSPEKWSVESKISLTGNGVPYGGTGIVNNGEIRNGVVCLNTGNKKIRKPLGNTGLSWKWGLIAVVQKMAEDSTTALQFAMLDEFDALFQNQNLKFRRKVTLDCGNNRKIDFKVFELTGDGVLPTVYWVDNMNRTIFVVSGMEAYVLKD